jgi:truncated hemoglobin YjbI
MSARPDSSTPRENSGSGATLYESIGGMDACRKLSSAFYSRVERDPRLRPVFPSSFHCAIEAFATYLAQLLGGPCQYSQRRWWLSLRESHLRFKIGLDERNAWLSTMRKALQDVTLDDSVRNALDWFFERSSVDMVNRGKAPEITDEKNATPRDHVHEEIDQRWIEHQFVGRLVGCVRTGNSAEVIALLESPVGKSLFNRDRAGLLSVLALMSGSRSPEMVDHVRQTLIRDPALLKDRHVGGRTLLHSAAGDGVLTIVELLLRLGADPNATDGGGHSPLYCVGNECHSESGADVVRALALAGANVNASGGVKRCTALHMAARRGNVPVAEALLDCGASLEARDSAGESPLRRAVNCDKAAVAALLLSRGADPDSVGSKGLTPRLAARSDAVRRLMRDGVER